MRYIFSNLHSNSFILQPLKFRLIGKASSYEHRDMVSWLLGHNKKIYIYINEEGTSFSSSVMKQIMTFKFFRRVECLITCHLNGIPLKSVIIIDDYKKIINTDVVLFYFLLGDELLHVNEMKGYKLMSCNHIHCNDNALRLIPKMNGLFAESDIFENSKMLLNN